jgi:hypothetical protein
MRNSSISRDPPLALYNIVRRFGTVDTKAARRWSALRSK